MPAERVAEEWEIKRLKKVAQRVNERVTGHFGVIRKAEGSAPDGRRLEGEERVNVRCFIRVLGTFLSPFACATAFHVP